MKAIPETHLRFAVLISTGNNSGTGFFFRTDNFVYLITAGHVLFDDSGKLRASQIQITVQSHNSIEEDRKIIKADLSILKPEKIKSVDIAVVKIGKFYKRVDDKSKIDYLEGITYLQEGKVTPVSVAKTTALTIDDVEVAADIYIFGYPSSLGISLDNSFNKTKPLIRKGIVSNVYKENNTIILDCPVYPGNSGGPVVQATREKNGTRKYMVIGVISKYIPYVTKWFNNREQNGYEEIENSGYSVATCLDPIFTILE